MSRGLLGYGRYPDGHVGCPRAQSDMTPCVARDGKPATADDGKCVGCNAHPSDLLTLLVAAVTEQQEGNAEVDKRPSDGSTDDG